MSKKLPIFIGLLFVTLFAWLSIATAVPVRFVLTRLNYSFYDIELRLHLWMRPQLAKGPVAIVDVDDLSLKEFGRWPWPRSFLALVEQLKRRRRSCRYRHDVF